MMAFLRGLLDVSGLVVGIVGTLILVKQCKLTEQQTVIAGRQSEISEKQSELMRDQNQIAAEQAAIARAQTSLSRQQTDLMKVQTDLMANQTIAAEAQAVPAYAPRLERVRELTKQLKAARSNVHSALSTNRHLCSETCRNKNAGELIESMQVKIRLSKKPDLSDIVDPDSNDERTFTKYESYLYERLGRISRYKDISKEAVKDEVSLPSLLTQVEQNCRPTPSEVERVKMWSDEFKEIKPAPGMLYQMRFLWPFFLSEVGLEVERNYAPTVGALDDAIAKGRSAFVEGIDSLIKRCEAEEKNYEERMDKFDRRQSASASAPR